MVAKSWDACCVSGPFESCQLYKIAGNAAGSGKLSMSKEDSEKSLQVMEKIVKKLSSQIKVEFEWKWYNYLTATVLGLSGVAAIAATGESKN